MGFFSNVFNEDDWSITYTYAIQDPDEDLKYYDLTKPDLNRHIAQFKLKAKLRHTVIQTDLETGKKNKQVFNSELTKKIPIKGHNKETVDKHLRGLYNEIFARIKKYDGMQSDYEPLQRETNSDRYHIKNIYEFTFFLEDYGFRRFLLSTGDVEPAKLYKTYKTDAVFVGEYDVTTAKLDGIQAFIDREKKNKNRVGSPRYCVMPDSRKFALKYLDEEWKKELQYYQNEKGEWLCMLKSSGEPPKLYKPKKIPVYDKKQVTNNKDSVSYKENDYVL